jgi:hypothetical protein
MHPTEYHPEVLALFEKDAWSEHPEYPRSSWRDEVAAEDTQLGYWDWASKQIFEAEEEAAETSKS